MLSLVLKPGSRRAKIDGDGWGWLAGWLMYLPPAKATPTQFCPKIWLISPRIWPADTSWISGRLLAGSWLATGWVASWLAGWLMYLPPAKASPAQFCPKILLVSPRIWPADRFWISGWLLAASWLATGWLASWPAGWLCARA